MHNRHAWTERTEEGIKREIRVTKRGGAWRFQAKRADQQSWEYFEEAMLDDVQKFREILFRKYQRRRATFEDVQWADHELGRRSQGCPKRKWRSQFGPPFSTRNELGGL
jgi:hypothetical protein